MSLRSLRRLSSIWACLALSATVTWGYGVQQILRHQADGFDGLDEVSSVTTSADGRHVYAGGFEGLMVMERNATTGRLAPLQTLRAEFGYDVYGLRSLALSPDGRHLYGAGSVSDSLVVFERDVVTGFLTLVETIDGHGAEFNLNAVVDVLVDPTGRHVYVVAQQARDVLGFSRDSASGRLQFINRVDLSNSIAVSLPTDAKLAPGGEHLYLAGAGAVVTLKRDTATGVLELLPFLPISQLAPLTRGDFLEIEPSGTMVYVFGSLQMGGRGIIRLQRDASSGVLTPLEALTDPDNDWGLGVTSHLLMAADGKNLYATAAFRGEGLVAFSRAADGELTHLQTLVNGEDGITGLDGPWEPVLSPDGRHLYVPAEDDEALAVFERSGTGTLSPVEVVVDGQAATLDGLDDPYFVLTSQEGQDVVVLGWNNEALARYERAVDGSLSLAQVLPLRSFVAPGVASIRQLTVSPDGSFLLARSDVNDLLFLARQADGSLEFLSLHNPGIQIRRAFFSPDNRFLYTTDGETELAVFEFGGADGQLTLRHQISRGGEPFETLAFDPSGRFLYAAGREQGFPSDRAEIYLFELDAVTGEPTFVDQMDVAGGVGRRFWELVISPDGRFAAAAGSTSTDEGPPGLVIFDRDLATGRLTETQRFVDGIAGVDFFFSPRELSLSANGRYLALNTNGTLNFLERNPDSGLVEIRDQKVFGMPGQPDELAGRGALAWSPEGEHLYMPSTSHDALVVWSKTASQCVADATTLCLGEGGRFRVEVTWRDFVGETGVGSKVTESTDSALFWFFDASNWEMLVKVIDGCSFNDHYWVFAAATTNVEYALTVTDTETGAEAIYGNSLGQSSEAITDSQALATCP